MPNHVREDEEDAGDNKKNNNKRDNKENQNKEELIYEIIDRIKKESNANIG